MTDTQALPAPYVPDGWTDLDSRAVDTVRVLAADAVQKVGNGHPGTAMSLAPVAYLLFQKVMRHNPADTALAGSGPVRAVLRPLQPDPVHPALPRRVRPRAGRPQVAADLGLQDPGPPRVRPHRRAWRSPPARSARASPTPSAWPWPPAASAACWTPTPPPGESPFDHQIYCLASDGDIEEGVSSRGVLAGRHPAAGQPDPDLRQQPDLHRGRHQHRPDRGRRGPLRRVRLARPDGRLDQRRHPATTRTSRPCTTRSRRPGRSPTSRASSSCGRSSRWPAPKLQGTGKAHGSALGAEEVAATKKVLGFDPEQTFEVADEVIAHTRKLRERGQQAQDDWQQQLRRLGRGQPRGQGALRPVRRRRAEPRAGTTTCPAGTPTPRASPPGPRPAR